MDVNPSKSSDSEEIDFNKSEVILENQVFKKPVFIGPRKGIKGLSKKPLNSNSSNNINEVENIKSPILLELESGSISNYPSLSYNEPNWKGLPSDDYFLEELKSGVIQRTVALRKKSFIVFGRIDVCDIVMAHPTVSRYHAILQYRGVPDGELDKGYYLYDLDSTHGTYLNKSKLKSMVYVRIKVGHMIKFGCSTRFFLLQGPEHDEEEESDLSVTELKEKRKLELEEKQRKEEEEEQTKLEEEEREKQLIEERGISWGLGEDADEEEDLSENPYALTTNEELYSDDPKKALRHWFEREGEEFHFLTEQAEKGMIACKIVLPLDDGEGKEIVVEISARSKKEAQVQCALEACRTIDKMGLFRQSKQEAKRHQKRDWEENDYYDSDEDSFFDRTGDLDVKRQKRMQKAGKVQETVETYESLIVKHKSVVQRLNECEVKLQKLLDLDKNIETGSENEELDALDTFMNTLKQDRPSKLDIKIAREEVSKLKKEEDHLRKLVNIVKPVSMPELKPSIKLSSPPSELTEKKQISKVSIKDESKFKRDLKPIHEDENPRERKKTKVIGPALPLDNTLKKKNNKPSQKKQEIGCDENTEEGFVNLVWQPPKGQTGDGRTSLNDKFGY